jgi:hypothetical protein
MASLSYQAISSTGSRRVVYQRVKHFQPERGWLVVPEANG